MLCDTDTYWNHLQDNFFNWCYLVWWCQGGSPLLCLPGERWEGENISSLVHPLCQRSTDWWIFLIFSTPLFSLAIHMSLVQGWQDCCHGILSSSVLAFGLFNYSNAVLTTFLVSFASRFRFEHSLWSYLLSFHVHNFEILFWKHFIKLRSDQCLPL